MAHALPSRLRPAPPRVATGRRHTRCVAGDVAPPPQGASRRAALLASTGLVLSGLGGYSAAHAGGLERYVRKPKPPPALETLVANALLAQVQLQQLGEW